MVEGIGIAGLYPNLTFSLLQIPFRNKYAKLTDPQFCMLSSYFMKQNLRSLQNCDITVINELHICMPN